MSEELDLFRGEVRDFVARDVAPHAEAWTRERMVPRALLASAGRAGLFGLKVEGPLGGSARPYAFTRAMLEEFGASGHMGCLLSLVLQSEFALPHLAVNGSDALRKKYVPGAVAGDVVLSIAMTEPEGGSDLAHLRTTATVVDGGAAYRIDGRKWMIGNASLADVFLVVCRDAGDAADADHNTAGDAAAGRARKMPRGTLLLVERNTPGLVVGRQLDKTGLLATPNCEVSFERCVVPADHVVGRAGLALPQSFLANSYERVALAIVAQGAMRAGFASAVRFLASRGSLLELSPWRHRLTEDWMRIEMCERVLDDAVRGLAAGKPDPALVLFAKVACTDTARDVLQHFAQAHGARGFLAEELIGRLANDARALTVGGGASEALIDALARVVLRPT